MPKKKLHDLHQIHGQEEEYQASTLEQLWGDKGLGKYHTLNEAEYVGYLKELNKSDLQTHATKMGILPTDDRELLTKKLLKEFKTHVASFRKPKGTPSSPQAPSKSVSSILAEGR